MCSWLPIRRSVLENNEIFREKKAKYGRQTSKQQNNDTRTELTDTLTQMDRQTERDRLTDRDNPMDRTNTLLGAE